jgi:peptidoglycan/LPS O-acetylase OafA/YrhL
MPHKGIYYPNLNALRFIAAFMVIIHHIEQTKGAFGFDNYWSVSPIYFGGKLGVVLFFVLSGFLITNLLLIEQQTSNTVSIKNFYIRRILRIWPLYFLIIILAFFVLPHLGLFNVPGYSLEVLHMNFAWKLVFFILLLPNYVLSAIANVPFAVHTWSIGVEEQFYLVWPATIKFFKGRAQFIFMLSVVVFYLVSKAFIRYYAGSHPSNGTFDILKNFWENTPIDCMAVGGIFSLICNYNWPAFIYLKQLLFRKSVQYLVFIPTVLLLVRGLYFHFLNYEVYSILFGIIICNLSLNPDRIIDFERFKFLSYLGKISYGLYMYHTILIVFVINMLIRFNYMKSWLLYSISFAATIMVAAISYRFFEKPFITKKIKFSTVISGDNVKD